jgi:hypothetical protein
MAQQPAGICPTYPNYDIANPFLSILDASLKRIQPPTPITQPAFRHSPTGHQNPNRPYQREIQLNMANHRARSNPRRLVRRDHNLNMGPFPPQSSKDIPPSRNASGETAC